MTIYNIHLHNAKTDAREGIYAHIEKMVTVLRMPWTEGGSKWRNESEI